MTINVDAIHIAGVYYITITLDAIDSAGVYYITINVDAIPIAGVYYMIMKNFQRHYNTNRAPFGLSYHPAW
jgi:hypothetical protein